ncbi:MAG TPA: cytochrome c biogenesis protein CcdA [Pirellulales bacterium]|nr:cytochrome c biogenesis protein CcdA [Pirellulales bacterium]
MAWPFCLTWLASLVFACAISGPLVAQADPLDQVPSLGGSAFAGEPSVAVSAEFTVDAETRNGQLAITATVAPGSHIYSITQEPRGPTPSEIRLDSSEEFTLLGDFKPTTAPRSRIGTTFFKHLRLEEHEGTVTWIAPIAAGAGVDVAEMTITGELYAQSCTAKNCLPARLYPFEAEFVAKLSTAQAERTEAAVQADDSFLSEAFTPELASSSKRSLAFMIGSAFLGGLILNLMPCVLPVIGLKILSFVEQGGHDRRRAFLLNLWYSLGILTVFLSLATLPVASWLMFGKRFGWGQQFTSLPFTISMACVVFVMALSFLGVWEIPVPGFAAGRKANELTAREGRMGAFLKGVLTTVLATPCSGPFLGVVLAFAVAEPPHVTYTLFVSIGLGMASPYLLMGLFPSALGPVLKFLKPGAWMETLKELMGFVLLGTVVWLFRSVEASFFVPTFAFLIGLWLAFWYVGRTPHFAELPQKLRAWSIGSIVVAGSGYLSFALLAPHAELIDWRPFSLQSLSENVSEGKTVLLDFTANWCATCQVNEALALNTREVHTLVEELDVVALRADWTRPSAEIETALQKVGADSIPLYIVFPGDRQQKPIVLRDLVTKGQIAEALRKAGPSQEKQRPTSPQL